MGAKTSKTNTSLAYRSVLKSTNEFISKKSTNKVVDTGNKQTMKISGVKLFCEASFTQDSVIEVVSLMESTTQNIQDLKTSVLNDLKSQLKNNSKTDEGLGGGLVKIFNKQSKKTQTKIEKEIETALENSVSVESYTSSREIANNIQTMDVNDIVIDPCGKLYFQDSTKCDVACNFNQAANVQIVSQMLAADITKQLSESETINKVITNSENSSEEKEGGIGDAFAKAFGLGDALSSMAAVVGVVMVIGLIVVLMLGRSPAGQQAIAARAGGGMPMYRPQPMYMYR